MPGYLDEALTRLPRRLHVCDRGVYLIRDVYDGRRFDHCEYGVLNDRAELVWRRCPEGVEFSTIEPLGQAEKRELA